jgi:hypothetical protein
MPAELSIKFENLFPKFLSSLIAVSTRLSIRLRLAASAGEVMLVVIIPAVEPIMKDLLDDLCI